MIAAVWSQAVYYERKNGGAAALDGDDIASNLENLLGEADYQPLNQYSRQDSKPLARFMGLVDSDADVMSNPGQGQSVNGNPDAATSDQLARSGSY
jgi:hypothetical protein